MLRTRQRIIKMQMIKVMRKSSRNQAVTLVKAIFFSRLRIRGSGGHRGSGGQVP